MQDIKHTVILFYSFCHSHERTQALSKMVESENSFESLIKKSATELKKKYKTYILKYQTKINLK